VYGMIGRYDPHPVSWHLHIQLPSDPSLTTLNILLSHHSKKRHLYEELNSQISSIVHVTDSLRRTWLIVSSPPSVNILDPRINYIFHNDRYV
jgi:hypothetical protein